MNSSSRRSAPSASPPSLGSVRVGVWLLAVGGVALLPFARGISSTRVFYIRDLAAFFWGRHLWLRQAWLSGRFPLWDSHLGGGQAAYSDALNQMVFPPAMLLRLVGNDVLGFNLWVAAAFPVAAAGAWLFFARRFSRMGAAVGAVAFSVCGPVVATANTPNWSWAVALMPWVLWATDRLIEVPSPRRMPMLAVTIALQALAGEPVTLFVTAIVAGCYAAAISEPSVARADRVRQLFAVAVAMGLGLLLAAVQVLPMVLASRMADRGTGISPDVWSLRPTALLELVWLHLFGDYFQVQSLAEAPWMLLMFGREPLLFSIYMGVPLLALSASGLAGSGPRRWRLFWTVTGIVSVVLAFGAYTPLFPPLRDHVPPFGTFRFPVKYLMAFVMAVAAGAACGWDVAWSQASSADSRRRTRARIASLALPAALACLAAAVAALAFLAPQQTTQWLQRIADAFDDSTHTGGAAMLQTIRSGALPLLFASLGSAALIGAAGFARSFMVRRLACGVLGLAISIDLIVHAFGLNPVIDRRYFDEPRWVALTRADAQWRYYVGGRLGGTLDPMDFDGSRGFENAPGLRGSASRATLNIQAAFYPSAWGAQELLSYDLPVLWPREYQEMESRFSRASREERDRLLDRTAARYRVLPQRRAVGRHPIMPIPQFLESFLFDFGTDTVARRVSVVDRLRVVDDQSAQIEALFQPGWDSRVEAMVARMPAVAGTARSPVDPFARIVHEGDNDLEIEAGVGADGGSVIVLDTFSPDWQASVDDLPADMVLANGLFRAVRIQPGTHIIRFRYRPRALRWGAAGSLVAAIGLMALAAFDRKASRVAA